MAGNLRRGGTVAVRSRGHREPQPQSAAGVRIGIKLGLLTGSVWLLVLSNLGTVFAASVENLALRAKVSASAEFSTQYAARGAVDGKIPKALSQADAGAAWCAPAQAFRKPVSFSLEWPEPQSVAEIVYYGRTAFMWTECLRNYEVLLDDAARPVTAGEFQMADGPQRVALPAGAKARKVTLRFLASYGGSNPGASEIQVYAASPPAEALGKLVRPEGASRNSAPAKAVVAESPELAAELKAGKLGFTKLIVVQRHHIQCSHVYTYHCEGQKDGGGLFVHDVMDGSLTPLLDSTNGQVLSYDLSWDASELLVAWRKGRFYQIYRMNADGSNPRQITSGDHHNFDPVWLPDGGVAFLSTRTPLIAYCWTSDCGVLHRMEADGSGVRRISWNYLNDFTPALMNDGRLIYGRWEYVDRPAIPIQSLWTINPDGTKLEGYFGNRVLDPATFIEARPVPGTNQILTTMTGHNGTLRGAIGLIDITYGDNAQEAIRNLTPEVGLAGVERSSNGPRGPYSTPFPLDAQHYLVSRDGQILLRETDGSRQAVVLHPAAGQPGFYNPQPLRPRQRPPVRSSGLPEAAKPWATLYVQDIYQGLEPAVKRGDVKRLMVVEEMPKPIVGQRTGFGFQRPVVSCGATYTPKRVWGFADVNADGSVAFKVPANRAIYFLPLDAQGRAVQRMRTFTHLMPGEMQGCVGCHESRSASPHVQPRPCALAAKPQDLAPPDWGVRGFDYASIVQPVLDQHCVRCHNARSAPRNVDLTGDRTAWFNVSYDVLAYENSFNAPGANGPRTGPNAQFPPPAEPWRSGSPYVSWIATMNGAEANILQIAPLTWGSPCSKLADLVLAGHPGADGRSRVNLSAAERQRILTWIDVNVPYYGTATTTHQNLGGGRALAAPALANVLKEVSARRCAECHKGRLPAHRVRFTNIEDNAFLLAPLAKSAGGSERCGRAVFAGKNDPDYIALLKCFEPVAAELARNPRQDMPGAEILACERESASTKP